MLTQQATEASIPSARFFSDTAAEQSERWIPASDLPRIHRLRSAVQRRREPL